MIKEDKYKEILESGLILDHFLLLCDINQGISPVKHKRIQGYLNLLTKKGYLDDESNLTDKGQELIADYVIVKPTSVDEWYVDLYTKCQDKIQELKGKKQVVDRIKGGKGYSFMPNIIDFTKILKKVMSLYKITDREKVEKALLGHIQKCNDANSWFPVVRYYIQKDGYSQLVTDMESVEEEEEGFQSSQKFL